MTVCWQRSRERGRHGRTFKTSAPGYAVAQPFLNAAAFTSNSAPYSTATFTFLSILAHVPGRKTRSGIQSRQRSKWPMTSGCTPTIRSH